MFDYQDMEDHEKIDDRLMVPLEALELAVQGGWGMKDFVSDLKGENGEQAKEVADMYLASGGFLYTPQFWFCLGKTLGWSGTLSITFANTGQSYLRPIYQALRWAECALTAKPKERLRKQEDFWTDILTRLRLRPTRHV